MNNHHDNIQVGLTILRYYDAYSGWMLPGKTFTRNPLKAQRIAEQEEDKRNKHKQAWTPWEVQFLMERNPNLNMRSIANKLDREVSDVRNMISAISPD